ncbi:hypothetical protein ABZ714_19415 [Streptomyces sp. NPDC006798]|uniref:hypothetical protein n=1 Tax=Streptomyces sp. NPDC006798 TaxID=3155462 RepID=UPI0034048348
MKMDLQLGDRVFGFRPDAKPYDEQLTVDLPAVPRVGEEVLITEDDGETWQQSEYRVRAVDWSVTAQEGTGGVMVRLDRLPEDRQEDQAPGLPAPQRAAVETARRLLMVSAEREGDPTYAALLKASAAALATVLGGTSSG